MFRKILYIITILLVLLLGYFLHDLYDFKSEQNQEIVSRGEKITTELSHHIDSILVRVISESKQLAQSLSQNKYTKPELEQLIINNSGKMNEILGITVAYEPFAFDESTRLYAPYFDKKQKKILRIEDSYDYTDSSLSTAQWYTQTMDQGAHWTEPYYAEAAQTYVSDYSIPFYDYAKKETRGVVALTISLKGFTKLIHALSLGKTGMGFVSSENGIFLAHPNQEFIGKKSLKDQIKEENQKELITAYTSLLEGKKGYTEFKDVTKDQKTLFFYDQVLSSQWKIGVLFFKQDMLNNDLIFKRKYINIAITISFLLFFLLAVFFNRDYLSVSEIWYLSLFASIVLILNIIFVGYLEHNRRTLRNSMETPPISDLTTLQNLVNSMKENSVNTETDSLLTIPTGLYIERLELGDSYNIDISGRLWQKYDTVSLKQIQPGFRFPQLAPFAESSFIEESFRDYTRDKVLIGYDFRTTVRLNFQYDHYPFDKRNISLEIQPKDMRSNLLLIPDLKSYSYTNPSQKSGINNEISLPGSKITESFYNYKTQIYNTNFGFEERNDLRMHTRLHYNINVKRILITSFVTYLIPIFVTLIMMFILIYATEKSEDKQAGGGIVQGMAAFFFVLIFSHIDLRKDVMTADLVYMEYFYFAAYAMIIVATYNLITYTRRPHRWFDYKDNLVMKTTFWPIFLLCMLVMTLVKFY